MARTSIPRPQPMAATPPRSAASRRYAPNPAKRKSRCPTVKISAAIKKNHPPAQLIMLFQMRLMAAKGSSSTRQRGRAVKPNMVAASRSSLGMVFSD